MAKEPSALIIPFGKHKGSSVADVLANDPQYAEWLMGQSWLAERFAELHAAIMTRGAVSDDSPEHNAIQARFLDPVFRAAFVLLSVGTGRIEETKDDLRKWEMEVRQPNRRGLSDKLKIVRRNIEHWKNDAERLQALLEGCPGEELEKLGQIFRRQQDAKERCAQEEQKAIEIAEEISEGKRRAEANPIPIIFKTTVQFEQRGVDVVISWWTNTADQESKHPGSGSARERPVPVEIKPSLGDDFPAVMRQMQRLDSRYLLIDRHAGTLPLETVRQMFAVNGRKLITVREVEAELANARAMLATD